MDKRGTFLIIGIIFWIVAAGLMHYLGPVFLDGALLHILFWIANFAFAAVAIILIAKLTGRTKHDMLAPVALIAMPAMVLDGLSITLDAHGLTHIYADTALLSAYSGGFLLFAFWSFFFFALVWHRES